MNIQFSTDNDAFGGGDDSSAEATECVRILIAISDSILDGETDGPVIDINGNTIGKWSMADVV